MGYVVNFTDNSLVTAEYLNDTAAELGGGALAFQDDMTYGVDDLNGISAELITKGVTRGCGLSVADGCVIIGEGVLYMSDGRRVVIDSAGVTLEFVSGSVNYVWFDYDAVTGFVAPRCTVEEPAADDYVILGRVTAEGTIEGKPDKAVMKNPFLGLHGSESFTKTLTWDGTTEEKLLWEIEPEDVGYQHVAVYSPGYTNSIGEVYNACCGFVNLADKTAFSALSFDYYGWGGKSDNAEVAVRHSRYGNYSYILFLRFELGTDNILRIYQRARSIPQWPNHSYGEMLTITLC